MADRVSVLELHDAGLALVDASGVRATSPSVAVESGDGLEVGARAAALSRRNPRRTIERFWEELDQDPLPHPLGPARTRADVAYFHLKAFWGDARGDETEVLLAVPAAFDRAQRSLLVGIARACALPLVGVVEASVAAAATVDDPRSRAVLDAGLHRATVTTIEVADGLALGESRTLAATGLARLRDAWIERIAARFLRETRFDPLHDARTEQLLHDRLPEWLATLATVPVAVLELPVGERRVRIELPREALVEPARETYRALADAAAHAPLVHVSSRLAALPGFVETVSARAAATVLERGAAGRAALAHVDSIRSDPTAPAFVTRLPHPIPAATAAPSRAEEAGERPTHLLRGSRAYPIGTAPLLVDSDPPRRIRVGEVGHGCVVRSRGGKVMLDVPEGASAAVDGRVVSGEVVLRAGNSLRTSGGDARLVTVDPDDGT